jgi:hypothetical protein
MDMEDEGEQVHGSGAATYGADLTDLDMTVTMTMRLAEFGADGAEMEGLGDA